MSNHTLFPDIPTPEQIARYQEIRKILDDYYAGKLPMSAVNALTAAEVITARKWVTQMSISLLEKDIPEFGDDLDEELQ